MNWYPVIRVRRCDIKSVLNHSFVLFTGSSEFIKGVRRFHCCVTRNLFGGSQLNDVQIYTTTVWTTSKWSISLFTLLCSRLEGSPVGRLCGSTGRLLFPSLSWCCVCILECLKQFESGDQRASPFDNLMMSLQEVRLCCEFITNDQYYYFDL